MHSSYLSQSQTCEVCVCECVFALWCRLCPLPSSAGIDPALRDFNFEWMDICCSACRYIDTTFNTFNTISLWQKTNVNHRENMQTTCWKSSRYRMRIKSSLTISPPPFSIQGNHGSAPHETVEMSDEKPAWLRKWQNSVSFWRWSCDVQSKCFDSCLRV